MLDQINPYRRAKRSDFASGAIVYVQDALRPLGGIPRYWTPVRYEPWIVESWGAARSMRHLATVRSLRTGRRRVVADWLLRASEDHGGEWAPQGGPGCRAMLRAQGRARARRVACERRRAAAQERAEAQERTRRASVGGWAIGTL